MNDKQQRMATWLKSKITEHKAAAKALAADDRADESAFEKTTANIYDIFSVVLSVAVRNCPGDDAAVGDFFRIRLEHIPAGWAGSLAKAREHGEEKQIRIEEIKLNVVKDIWAMFREIWEVNA